MPKRPLRGASVGQWVALPGLLFLVPLIGDTFTEITKAAQSELAGTTRSFAERCHPYSGEEIGLPLMAREAVRMIRRLGLWTGWSKLVGITNDLTAAGSKGDRIHERLNDGHSIHDIWTALATHEELSVLALLAVVAVAYWLHNRQHFKRYRPALVFGVCVPLAYLAILFLVYLTTPLDLWWHLKYSASRTRLALHTCFAMGLLGPILAEVRGVRSYALKRNMLPLSL